MARAKQMRRLARLWAERLGLISGAEDATIHVQENVIHLDNEDALEYLRDLRDPSKEDWDSGARNACAHEVDGVPAGELNTYYRAYNLGADRVVMREIKAVKAAIQREDDLVKFERCDDGK